MGIRSRRPPWCIFPADFTFFSFLFEPDWVYRIRLYCNQFIMFSIPLIGIQEIVRISFFLFGPFVFQCCSCSLPFFCNIYRIQQVLILSPTIFFTKKVKRKFLESDPFRVKTNFSSCASRDVRKLVFMCMSLCGTRYIFLSSSLTK